MDETPQNGKASPGRRPKPRVRLGTPTIDRERYFDIVATVRITGYGNPDKETFKYLNTLQHIVDLNFPDAEVSTEIVLP